VPDPIDDQTWRSGLEATLADPASIAIVLQPIVDLQRGVVVGHEALSRFAGPPAATPDRWFAAAERHGVGPALSAATVRAALAWLPGLPPNTFLTINLEPGHLDAPEVLAALDTPSGRLDRVIVELTEHTTLDVTALTAGLDGLRTKGGRVALDDAGSGYAGLSLLLELRPDVVKLDRSLVTGLDIDPVRRVLLRSLGELTASIDAWILAEGIETAGELEELVALGVPLGQGYLLGRPQPGFTPQIDVEVARAIIAKLQRTALDELAASLLERVPLMAADDPAAAAPAQGSCVLVDALGRPCGLGREDGSWEHELLLAKPSETVRAVAHRAATRRRGRFTDAVVLTDGRGQAIGIVSVQRLLEALSQAPGDA
jgi:EAL domain-containing protein (putative c-di-GMP-specific phosphodiesterase class I)